MQKNRLKVIAGIAAFLLTVTVAVLFLVSSGDGYTRHTKCEVSVAPFSGKAPPEDGLISVRSESFMTGKEGRPYQFFFDKDSLREYIIHKPYNPSGEQVLGVNYPAQNKRITTLNLTSDLFLNPGTLYVDYAYKDTDASIFVKVQNVNIRDERFYKEPVGSSPYTEMFIYFEEEDLSGIEKITVEVANA